MNVTVVSSPVCRLARGPPSKGCKVCRDVVVGVRSGGPRGKLVAFQIAAPPAAGNLEIDVLACRIERELLDRQAIGRGVADLLLGQGLGQLLVIEGRPPPSLFRLDEDELMAARSGADLVPELAVRIEPVRLDAVAEDLAAGQVRQFGRPGVIGLRALGWRKRRNEREAEEEAWTQ